MHRLYTLRVFCLLPLLFSFFLGACQNQPGSAFLESITPSYPEQLSTNVPNETDVVLSTPSPQEFLVIWGKETWPDGACVLWIANPDSQNMTRTVMEMPWCNFAVLTVSGEQKLVSFPLYYQQSKEGTTPSEIIVYEVKDDGTLQINETISLQELRLTSAPQWESNNIIFFSAINHGRESIYRYDKVAQIATPYIVAESGFATAPVISSDGRYIAYEVWEDHETKEHNSRDDCGQLTCFSRFLHVWDVKTNKNINLTLLIESLITGEPFFSHCKPEWSRTNNLLAFNVGCEQQIPGSIVVIDFRKDSIPVVINPVDSTRSIGKFHWSEGNRLILYGTAQIYGQDIIEDGYSVYSADENALEKMTGLSERNLYDYDLIYFSDWTSNAEFAVGQTQVPGDTRKVNIVIADSWDKMDEEEYVQTPDEFVDGLEWSPTDRNIAYRSYNWETEGSESRFLVINATGLVVFDSGMIQIVFPEFQWYIKP